MTCSTEEIRAALESGELNGLILFGVDPLRDFPDTKAWEAAITAADFVVCLLDVRERDHRQGRRRSSRSRPTPRKTAPSPTPTAASSASAPRAARPGDIRPNSRSSPSSPPALGHDTGIDSQPTAFAALTEAVPFYAGDHRRRHRRPRHPLAGHRSCRERSRSRGGRRYALADAQRRGRRPDLGRQPPTRRPASEAGAPAPSLALGTYRDLWAGPITELNPPLKFLTPQQRLEISPADAERLGLKSGDKVRVGQNGTQRRGHGRRSRSGSPRASASWPRASPTATPTPCSTAARSGSRSRSSSEVPA